MFSRLALQALAALAVLLLNWPGIAVAEGRPAGGFLWEASRGRDRVLLLGAIHVGRPEFASAPVEAMPQVSQAQVVVFEANIFDAQASLAASQRWAMYPANGPGLDAHVDAATLARIDKVIERFGGGIAACCLMKPWMLANTLVVLQALNAGFSPAYGSEARLYQFALMHGMSIDEIEGVDVQLRLFDAAAEDIQIDYLRHALEAIESGASRSEIERLVGAWERGDAGQMRRLVDELSNSNRAAQRFVAEKIIRGRHPRMLAAIERYSASDRLHLVVIGALHYFGPDGLLEGLRARGFTVTRLQ